MIESPYDSLSDPKARELFAKAIELKLAGYRAEYAYGVLPVDTTDFIAYHQLVCREENDGLVPLMGYRSVSLSRCEAHNLPFAGATLCRNAQAPLHERTVLEIARACAARGRSITYDSSWTIAPEARKDRDLTARLHAIFRGSYTLHHLDYGIDETICGGTLRFKADRFFGYWGYLPLMGHDGEILPPIRVASLLGEPVRVMHLRELSAEAVRESGSWKLLWKNRLTFASPEAAHEALAPKRRQAA